MQNELMARIILEKIQKWLRLQHVKWKLAAIRHRAGQQDGRDGILSTIVAYLERATESWMTILKAFLILLSIFIFILAVSPNGKQDALNRSIIAIREVAKLSQAWNASGIFLPYEGLKDSGLANSCKPDPAHGVWLCLNRQLKKSISKPGMVEFPFTTGVVFDHYYQIYSSQLQQLDNATEGWWWWILAMRDWKERHGLAFAENFPLSRDDTLSIYKLFSSFKNSEGDKKFLLTLILGKAMADSSIRAQESQLDLLEKLKMEIFEKITGVPMVSIDLGLQSSIDGRDVEQLDFQGYSDPPGPPNDRDSSTTPPVKPEFPAPDPFPDFEKMVTLIDSIRSDVRDIKQGNKLWKIQRNHQ